MTLSEGIVKINSRILDSTELKKYDKLEKEGISVCGYTNKGKKDIHDFSTVFFSFFKYLLKEFKMFFKNKTHIALKMLLGGIFILIDCCSRFGQILQ